MNLFRTILFSSIVLLIKSCDSSSLTSKIYIDLDSQYFCFKRLNATHQMGCGTSDKGNTGIIKILSDEKFAQDLKFITSEGPDAPYIAVLNAKHFKLTNLKELKNHSERVAGLIILDNLRPDAFSSDRSCPNEQFSLYANDPDYGHCSKLEWNKPTSDHKEGILFENWPFPIILLRNQTEIKILLNKTVEHDQWPKLAAELITPMSAAVDTVTCMRRSSMGSNSWLPTTSEQFCEPLGGINIYGHTITPSKKLENNSVVVLSSRLDTFSMFDGLAPGADSVMSSLITIISVVEVLNRPEIKRKMFDVQNKKSFLFALFDGEAFDYIGSGSAAFQMKNNKFPLFHRHNDSLNLGHLSHFIELDQVAYYDNDAGKLNIFLHKHLNSNTKGLVELIKDEAKDLQSDLIVNEIKDEMPLPPSSVQSFLKMRNDSEFCSKVVVITNHEKEYKNKFYNSMHEDISILTDDGGKNFVTKIKALSTLISRIVYKLVTEEDLDKSVESNSSLIENLFECFLENSDCYLFNILSLKNRSQRGEKPPYPSYVSVYKADSTKTLRNYLTIALNYFSGEKFNLSQEGCAKRQHEDTFHNCIWQIGISLKGECVCSTVYTEDALSPAFNAETLDIIDSLAKQFPLWTESKWKMTSLRIFVVTKPSKQIITLISGLIILLVSLVIVSYFVQNSEIYFDTLTTIRNSSSNDSLAENVHVAISNNPPRLPAIDGEEPNGSEIEYSEIQPSIVTDASQQQQQEPLQQQISM